MKIIGNRGYLSILATRSGTEPGRGICKSLSALLEKRYDKLRKKEADRSLKFEEKDEIDWISRLWERNEYICGSKDFCLQQLKTTRFQNKEIKVEIEESVRGHDCFLIHESYQDESNSNGSKAEPRSISVNTMEVFLTIWALKEAKARRVTLIDPYYPFARQDHIITREGNNAALMARLYRASGLDAIMNVDLHSPQVQGFLSAVDIESENFYSINILAHRFLERHPDIGNSHYYPGSAKEKGSHNGPSEWAIFSPDAGGAQRAEEYANLFGLTEMAFGMKKRNYDRANTVDGLQIIGNIKGKKIITIEDMFDTFGTMDAALKALSRHGAKEVHLIAPHAVLSGPGLDRLIANYDGGKGILKEVWTTDSIYRDKAFAEKHPFYNVVSLNEILGEMIWKTNIERSIEGVYLKDKRLLEKKEKG